MPTGNALPYGSVPACAAIDAIRLPVPGPGLYTNRPVNPPPAVMISSGNTFSFSQPISRPSAFARLSRTRRTGCGAAGAGSTPPARTLGTPARATPSQAARRVLCGLGSRRRPPGPATRASSSPQPPSVLHQLRPQRHLRLHIRRPVIRRARESEIPAERQHLPRPQIHRLRRIPRIAPRRQHVIPRHPPDEDLRARADGAVQGDVPDLVFGLGQGEVGGAELDNPAGSGQVGVDVLPDGG